MTEQIKFEDWAKLEMRVGEVVDVRNKITINCGRDFVTDLKLDVSKGDKIVVGLFNGGLIVPFLQGDIPIIPEKDIEAGCRVG